MLSRKGLKPHDLVWMEWVDSRHPAGRWDKETDPTDPVAVCRSVGWIKSISAREIVIVQSISNFGHVDDPSDDTGWHVNGAAPTPWCAVTKIRKLHAPK